MLYNKVIVKSDGVVGIFKLSNGSTRTMNMGKLASEFEIKNQKLRGYTHIVFDGESHFLYIEDDDERAKFQENVCLPNYIWFQEQTGLKNWVLYNPEHFKVDRNLSGKQILKFNKEKYQGGRLELPINASSCCGMFSWTTIPENLILGSRFNTKNISNMSLMFAGSILPKSFNLGDYFDTSNVEDMRYMFYECIITEGFKFNTKFNTGRVKNMEYMFARCKLANGIKLPEDFNTAKVIDMNHMFYESTFVGDFSFGYAFAISPNADTTELFVGSNVKGEIIDDKNNDFTYVKRILKER